MATSVRQVCLYLTSYCNLRCEMCGVPDHPLPHMTTEDTLRVIDYIAKEIRPQFLVLFGGEPLLRQDISALLDRVNRTDLPYTLITNGTQPIPAELRGLTFSIDVPLRHLQVLSSFPQLARRTVKATEALDAYLQRRIVGTDLVVSTIANNLTASHVPELVQRLSDRGVWTVLGIAHRGKGNWLFRKGDLGLNERQAVALAEAMLRLQDSGALVHNIPLYFQLMPVHWDLSWKCKLFGLDYLIIRSNGQLMACNDWVGDNQLGSINILRLLESSWPHTDLQELHNRDVQHCPGCYFNHKIQLAYSKQTDDVLTHVRRPPDAPV